MPTVSAIGTNYNLPQYHGRVHQLTPSDTPFLTALMGTAPGGGELVEGKSRTFEWQTFDLRDADQNTVVDADRVGTGEHRSRSNVFNVIQTHREDVDVAYERLAQTGQFDGQNIEGSNPITDEATWQITQMWKQIKRDIEFSAINGSYDLPSDNNTPAKTRGILEAITTNAFDGGGAAVTLTTSADSDDLLDSSAHGFTNGQDVYFATKTGGSALAVDTRYYVVNATTNSFQVAATPGGTPLDFGSDITAGTVKPFGTLTEESVGDLMQSAWDNGGLQESEMGLLICNSAVKRHLTRVFITDKGLETETRSVGGASVQTIQTDFGTLGIMLNRYIPQGVLATVSLDQCKPHFRLVPGKGAMFAEPTAKLGASEATQLYASFGLEYGNEASHAKLTNLTANAPVPA